MSGRGAGLRIGMLAPGYPSGDPGDYRGIFVEQMVRHLKARGHRVCVVTSRLLPGDPPLRRVDEAEEVHRFRFWSEGRHLVEYRRIPPLRTATYLVAASQRARRAFAEFQCDLVHSHFLVPMGLVGALAARRLGRPHLLTVHGSDSRMAMERRWMRPLARWILRRADRVTASAHHVMRDCATLGAGLDPPPRVDLLPMGIGAAFLAQAAPAERAAESPPGILSTRTLREDPYQVSVLLHAMKAMVGRGCDARCTIAGEGPDRARLEALRGELGLEGVVQFFGWAAPERLADLLRSHTIYVSTSRADGASVSLFEAMACGAYPVVADIEANREWIRDGVNGRTFPPGDAAALASAIERALLDPEGRRRAAVENRATAQARFAWAGIAQHVESIYMDLMGRGSSAT